MIAGLFLLFGCNDIIENNFVAETMSETNIETTADDLPEATAWIRVAKPILDNSARTALPEFDSDILENCSFVLKGALSSAETQQDLGSYENLAALSSASLPCEEGTWNFTLTASTSGTVFTGSLNGVEITSGSNELDFELAWDRTALTGEGSLNFALDFSAASNASAVKLATAELLSWNPTTQKETAISEYEETAIGIKDDKVTYIVTDLAAGNYRVKIHLYADTEKQHPINTWRELAIVTGGQESLASRSMKSLNKVYTITFESDGGEAATGTTLPTVYTRNSADITLPDIAKSGYAFGGWYTEETFKNKVSEIPAGSTGNKTFWAQWNRAAINVTFENTSDLTLTSEVSGTTVTFTVTGGTAPYTWNFYEKAQSEPETQSETSDTFVFTVPSLATGVYEIEVISGDLSSMATVFVNGTDSKLYVSATGNDENSGTATSPLATIAAAVAKMNDSEVDYTILVDGMLGRERDITGLTAGQSIAEVEAVQTTTDSGISYGYKASNAIVAKSITVKGLHEPVSGVPVDGIDTNFGAETNGKTTPVLLVATSVPVTIENLKLAGGWGKNGEALAVGFSRLLIGEDEATSISADVTIKDGVLITDSGNGTTEVPSPIHSAVVRTVSTGSILRMEGGSITGNTAGLGVLSVAYGSTFEMTGGSIKDNILYTGSTANSITCGVRVIGQPSDGSSAAGIFKISGDAVVDEVCPGTGAVVTVAGALNNATPIQILPSSYTDGTQVLAVTSNAGVTLSEACEYFTVKTNDGSHWTVHTDGKIYEGYVTSVEGLGTTLSSLAKNDADTPYTIKLTDAATSFATINSSLTSALDAAGKYVKVSFLNASFTSMEGTLSEYITGITLPASVTSMGFIDGENLAKFAVDSGNTTFATSGVVLFSKSLSKLYRCPPAAKSTTGVFAIAVNVTSIADGAFANCKNIAKFEVLEGNSYFKATTGGALNSLNNKLPAAQTVDYFIYNSSIGPEPDQFTSDGKWNTEYDTWSFSVGSQHVYYGYATIGGLLTSYDGKTLIACPPALKLYTDADVKELCGNYEKEKDQAGSAITYKAYSNFTLNFTSVKPYAFCGVKNLELIDLNVTSTSIPAYTFKDSASLKNVYLSISGNTINSYTFSNCTALSYVRFTSTSITTVKSNAFDGCTALSGLYFEAGESTGKAGTASDAYPSTCTVNFSGKVN